MRQIDKVQQKCLLSDNIKNRLVRVKAYRMAD